MSIFMLGFATSTLLSGILSKRYGKKNIILLSVLLNIIVSLISIYVANINQLIFARFIAGLSVGSSTVLGRLIVDKYYNDYEKVKILSYMSTLAAFCPTVIPMLGGAINELYGWRSVFSLIVVFGLIGLTLVHKNIHKSEQNKGMHLKESFHNYFNLIKNSKFRTLVIVNSMSWSLVFIYTNCSTFIFQSQFNLSSVEYAKLYGMALFGYVIGSVILRKYAKNYDLNKIVIIASVWAFSFASIMVVASIFITITPVLYTLFYFFILSSVGVLLPSCQALNLRYFKYCSTDSLGLHFFIQLSFAALLSIVLNKITQNINLLLVASATVTTLIMSIASILLYKKSISD
jgi:DHA1 family bicyclomycin/chloramphenicol resistance-like MFS transporter